MPAPRASSASWAIPSIRGAGAVSSPWRTSATVARSSWRAALLEARAWCSARRAVSGMALPGRQARARRSHRTRSRPVVRLRSRGDLRLRDHRALRHALRVGMGEVGTCPSCSKLPRFWPQPSWGCCGCDKRRNDPRRGIAVTGLTPQQRWRPVVGYGAIDVAPMKPHMAPGTGVGACGGPLPTMRISVTA
jgi:hypothetical protein